MSGATLLLALLACGGTERAEPGPTEASQAPTSADQLRQIQADFLRVRLHARFVELTDEGVVVRIDNPTDLAVDRAHIHVEGRSASGPWARGVWTGPLRPGEQDVSLTVPVPEQLIGAIRVVMDQAVPAAGQTLIVP